MNSLQDRFRNAAAFFWQHPVLWLPVLAADLCKSVFAQADAVFRHAVIVGSMPQSVLGGYGGGTSLPVVPIVLGGFLNGSQMSSACSATCMPLRFWPGVCRACSRVAQVVAFF